jgi:NDP-sugar pyrophosphorylase family protein
MRFYLPDSLLEYGNLRAMRGIVIAGGLGTRLRPLTLSRPKPLMPLVNAPLLEYQISYLKSAGIQEVCFATNYMADAVEAHFGDGGEFGVRLVYAVEDEPLDTGGAIRNAWDALPPDDCVVFNGDTIHSFDIASIIRRHQERKADVTLTLREVARPHAYGVVPLDEEGRVLGFQEPSEEQKRSLSGPAEGSDFINAGLYIINREIFEEFFPQRRCNVEREVFPRVIEAGKRVFGDVQGGFWIDIGRPSQYLRAVRAVLTGEVAPARPFRMEGDSAVAENAEVRGAVSGGSVISPGVTIAEGASVETAVLFEGATVGEGAVIRHSIIGENAQVEPHAIVENSVIGGGTVLTSYSRSGVVP